MVEDEYYDIPETGARAVPRHEMTRFEHMAGIKCLKLFWALHHEQGKISQQYDWIEKGIDYDEAALCELEQALCPDATPWVEGDELESHLAEREPISRAVVGKNGISATIDLLRPAKDGKWDIVQISAKCAQSLDISEKYKHSVLRRHVQDIAFQRHCCELAGMTIGACCLALVDGNYIRKGKLDDKILVIIDLTGEVELELQDVAPRIDALLKVSRMPECPPFKMFEGEADCLGHSHLTGCHCHLIEECREPVHGAGGPLPKLDDAYFDLPASGNLLGKIRYPIHIVDLSCLRRAIPFEGGKPYAPTPYALFVLSVKDLNSEPISHSWVWDGKEEACKAMLEHLIEASGSSGSILCEFGKSAIDEIIEIAEKHPEQLSMIKSLTSQAFEISLTIKREKSGELALHGVYYLDSVFPESCKGVSPDDGQIEEWLFIQSIYGNSCLDIEEVQLTINNSGTRRTRRVLEYLRKLKEMCYSA